MYFGGHSIRFYPNEDHVGKYLFDSEKELDICPDTWKTWKLIPNEKPIFASPEFDDELLQIPGRHGLVRLTKGGIGHTVYGNIKGSIDFTPDPDEITHFPGLYSDICRYLHGKERLAVLRDDRYFFYKGLFRVKSITPDKYYDKISIEYSLEPFKYERWDGSGRLEDDWRWNDFDFECGIARDRATGNEQSYTVVLEAEESRTVSILPRDIRMPLLAKSSVAGITVGGFSITAANIWYKVLYLPEEDLDGAVAIRKKPDPIPVVLSNSGKSAATVSLRYRGAEL